MKTIRTFALILCFTTPVFAGVVAEGFTKADEALLTKAMTIFNQRFLQKRVLQCAYKTATHSDIKESYFPLLSNGDFWKTPKEQWGLLNAQLFHMNAQFDKRGEKFLPNIVLKAYNDRDDDAVAYVHTDHHVVVEDDEVKGEFEIFINQRYLGTPERFSDPEYYAGVIMHELLHNLGHLHPKGDYRDYIQMIAFEKCFRADGKFEGKGWGFITKCSARPKP